MSFFTDHRRRHHNPRLHVIAAVSAAGGALVFVGEGYPVFTVFLAPLSFLNVVLAVAEHRRPDYRQQWAEEHMRMLRVGVQELGATDDEGS